MHVGDAAPYVAGAYIVVFVALVAYLWLIASKLGRLEERLDRLRDDARPSGELAPREEDEAA